MAEALTMADLRQACEDRLTYAIEQHEPGAEIITLDSDHPLKRFETPAGVRITRYAQLLSVECDFGETEDETHKDVRVEFVDGEEDPVEVLDQDRTIPRRKWDVLAAELSKYVTLIP